MYFRIAKRRQGSLTYQYLQLVEAYRQEGNNCQRVLYSFGNVEKLRQDGQLGRLIRSLERATGGRPPQPGLEALRTERVLEYGGVRVAQALWEQFDLTALLESLLEGRRFQFDPVAAIATMVCNRLLAPNSELGIFQWRDRLWWPRFAGAPLQLQHLYRALDALLEIKEPLEEQLFARLQHLFNLAVDVVFYDLTSSYFEGEGPPLASYGYSRDRRPDRRQVLLALACEQHGFPIAHEVLAGNRADVSTVQSTIAALQRRFQLRRVIFVADRGMVSQTNLQALTEAGYQYLVGMRRDRVAQAESHAPQDLSEYEPGPHQVLVHTSDAPLPGARYLCCWSEARAEQERQIREARIDKGRAALEKLAAQVAAGRLKRAHKIVARVTSQLTAAHASKYFDCEISEGQFQFALNQEQVAKERRLEGRYFLLTNAAALTPQEAVEAYFTLQEVERAFREMKDFLQLRPIYHWSDDRVRAHIFVCVLAYLLERSLSHQLRQAGLELSPREALDWASRVHAVENKLGDHTLWTVSRPAPAASELFRALGLSKLPTTLKDFDPPPAR
jgi:transposase